MIDVAAGGRLRFLARARDHGLFGFAFYSVRVGENEMAFVFGAGLQIEKAAGKHVGRDVAVVMPAAVARIAAEHLFVLQAQKRQALAPLLLAPLAIGDVDSRVAIVVAGDFPREAEREQSRRIDDEFAGNGVVLTPCGRGKQRRQCQEKKRAGCYARLSILSGAIDTGGCARPDKRAPASRLPKRNTCVARAVSSDSR